MWDLSNMSGNLNHVSTSKLCQDLCIMWGPKHHNMSSLLCCDLSNISGCEHIVRPLATCPGIGTSVIMWVPECYVTKSTLLIPPALCYFFIIMSWSHYHVNIGFVYQDLNIISEPQYCVCHSGLYYVPSLMPGPQKNSISLMLCQKLCIILIPKHYVRMSAS